MLFPQPTRFLSGLEEYLQAQQPSQSRRDLADAMSSGRVVVASQVLQHWRSVLDEDTFSEGFGLSLGHYC